MINIGVLVQNLASEYSINILNGITEFYKDKDVRLIIAQTKTPYADDTVYGYQCWTSVSFLKTPEIDALIVLTGEYTSSVSISKLSLALSDFKKIPVISIGQELFLPKIYFSQTNCKSAYREIISHLKNEHGCKKIGFFSANLTNSDEALERFESYKLGLISNGLEYDASLVLNGNYRGVFSHAEILKRYKNPEDVPFDALICANDLTAYGCQTALQEIGVKIPEDVKIIGFDDSDKAVSVFPKLSTLDQDYFSQGYNSAETAYKVLVEKNSKIPRISQTEVTPVYRQSCGCIPLTNKDDIAKYSDGKICSKSEHQKNRILIKQDFNDYLHEMKSMNIVFDMIKSDNTLLKTFYTLPFLLDNASISKAAVCLYETPVRLKFREDFILPKKMFVSMIVDREAKKEIFEPDYSFNPYKKLFLEQFLEMEKGNYIIQPIFSGELNYGCIMCKIKNNHYAAYTTFLRIIINAISQAYEYTQKDLAYKKLSEENLQLSQTDSDASTKRKIDSLTKVPDYHGFLALAQTKIDVAIENAEKGLVLYADLDNTREINEKYGKPVGDIAIKAMCSVLTKTLRANDIVARVGGDEFAAISAGLQRSQIEKIKQKIGKLCQEITEEKKFPFLLSITTGFAEFNFSDKKIKNLLNEAEKNMSDVKNELLELNQNLQTSENSPSENQNKADESEIEELEVIEELEEVLDTDDSDEINRLY